MFNAKIQPIIVATQHLLFFITFWFSVQQSRSWYKFIVASFSII